MLAARARNKIEPDIKSLKRVTMEASLCVGCVSRVTMSSHSQCPTGLLEAQAQRDAECGDGA